MPEHLKNYPLNPDRRDIRLLTLHPASTPQAPVECTLQVASINDAPQFEAVSYVWGDGAEKREIHVDGHPFEVILNVERVLSRIRLQTKPRVVWIDFICVNQESPTEKSTQVPLMGEIYAGASSVIAVVSLDNLRGDMTQAISWIEARHMRKWSWKTIPWWTQFLMSKFSHTARLRRMNSLLRARQFIQDFVFANYWTRMWTYQEFQLARSDPVCICGNKELQGAYTEYMYPMLTAENHTIEQMHRKLIEKGGYVLSKLYHSRLARRFEKLSSELDMRVLNKGIPLDIERFTYRKQDLIGLLSRTIRRECKDPKDKIFALYALFPSLQAAYPPDYNKPRKQVMYETAKFLIDREIEGLAMLEYFCLPEDRFRDRSVSSWVPDFSVALPTEARIRIMHVAFHPELSSDGWGDDRIVIEDPWTLKASARLIGTCKVEFRFKSDLQGIATQMIDLVSTNHDSQSHRTPDKFLQACLINANKIEWLPDFGEYGSSKIWEILGTIADQSKPVTGKVSESVDRPESENMWDWVLKLAGMTVFTVQSAAAVSFGIGDSEIEDEDRVMIGVHGIDSPVVMRQDDSMEESVSRLYKMGESNGRMYYKVVGVAHISGLSGYYDSKDGLYFDHVSNLPFEEFFLR